MLFTVHRASDYQKEWHKEINTLEELLAYRNEMNEDIIIRLDFRSQGDGSSGYRLTIYDDYLE